MILRQFVDPFSGKLSYLVGDTITHNAMLVDPDQDADLYVQKAQELGLRIGHIFLTMRGFQAEQVSARLAQGGEVTVYLGHRSNLGFPYFTLHDGDALQFGNVRLVVLETPGVVPEAICLLLYDLSFGDRSPVAVMTGPTLHMGDVGRCARPERRLAREFYDSIRNKLLKLPGEIRIYPGVAAPCDSGTGTPGCISTTLEEERRANAALGLSRMDFMTRVSAGT